MMTKQRRVPDEKDYAISQESLENIVPAPRLAYKPPRPRHYRPRIGVIGCGGIISTHLKAYRKAGYRVIALADTERERAERARDAFYPRALVFASAAELLALPEVDVVDIATHPQERVPLLLAAINAGKHVLSQKPFVMDLAVGRRIVKAAAKKGVRLAVNQNGRWAPHVSYACQAIAAGLLGDVTSVDMQICWDHNWTAKTPFDRVRHLLLFDFGIHWFDMAHCYLGRRRARSVYASICRTRSQQAIPPLIGQVVIEYPQQAQASVILRGDTRFGPRDRTVIVGTEGTLISSGPNINQQSVTLFTKRGRAVPKLTTQWFPDGFDGAMSELLCAIEENREPYHSARDNLQSLELCFAALTSADTHLPVRISGNQRTP